MKIQLRQVYKRFGQMYALKDINLTLEAGQKVALVGPNGSGKSTLIRAIMGLVACEGEVLLDNRAPYEDRVALAQRLAYVPQIAPQLQAAVKELVTLVTQTRNLALPEVLQVAEQLGLKLSQLWDRPFRNLSGGQKQKLLITLAVAARPELLIMDEPTASLDAAARSQFYGLMGQLPADTTLLLCSHRLEELHQLTHHLLELNEGQLTREGPLSLPGVISFKPLLKAEVCHG